MTTMNPTEIATGAWVIIDRKDGNGEPLDELDDQLARVLGRTVSEDGSAPEWAATLVRVAGGGLVLLPSEQLRLACLRDPTGLSTGRWRVRRDELVSRAGRPIAWRWISEPIPARGITQDEANTLGVRYFPRTARGWQRAVEHAISKAEGNIR
ncbi:hypothetical protein [Microbacterium sp. KNMS]